MQIVECCQNQNNKTLQENIATFKNESLSTDEIIKTLMNNQTDLLEKNKSAYRNSWTLDTGPWMLDPGRWTLDAGLWTLDPGCWTPDAAHWTLDSELWTQDVGLWMLNARLWKLKL